MKLPRLFFLAAPAFGLFAAGGADAQTNLWSIQLPWFYSDACPAIAPDGTLYQPEFNGNLMAVTPGGQVLWRFKAGLESSRRPPSAAMGRFILARATGNFTRSRRTGN